MIKFREHAKVGATLYSLPWRYLGERVDARSTTTMVQFFRHGELIKTHPVKERGKQTDYGDYPPEKIAFHLRTPTWCRRRATEVGPACEAVIGELLAENALFRLRAAQGVLGLGDKHDPGRLEAACAKATAAGDPSYRTIKGILAAGTETTATTRPTGDAGAPAHLHGPDQLFAIPGTAIPGTAIVPDLLADVIPLPTARGADPTDPTTTTPGTGHCHRADQQRGPLVSTQPSGPTAADRSPGDAAALLPTATGATQPADHPAAGHVTAGEIAEFLRHLARFRSPAVGGDPADQAALLARKAELFARIADQHAHAVTDPPSTAAPTTPTTPEGRTP